VASPAESGMTIILEKLCISSAEAHKMYVRKVDHICNTPSSCYILWSKKDKQQTNKLVMLIVASLNSCMASEKGKSTTVA